MDLKEQFEKETGNSAYSQGFQFKLYNEKYVEWLEEELEQRLEAGQHETIVSSTVDFEDFKRAVLLLQRAYCAIEPKQHWGDGIIVDYKPFISEANKFVNEIRHKYKF